MGRSMRSETSPLWNIVAAGCEHSSWRISSWQIVREVLRLMATRNPAANQLRLCSLSHDIYKVCITYSRWCFFWSPENSEASTVMNLHPKSSMIPHRTIELRISSDPISQKKSLKVVNLPTLITSWWFQPLWKYGLFPQVGVNIKNI